MRDGCKDFAPRLSHPQMGATGSLPQGNFHTRFGAPRRKGSSLVKHLIPFKRQFGFLLLGLTLALSVIIPLAVGATNPAPVSVNCSPQCLWLPPTPTTRPDWYAPAIEGVYTHRYY